MASYEDINYSLRPAKNIQRKMMCETFGRLTQFGPLNSYRYIGFGSTYFTDFTLFHKQLGIKSMLSIERDIERRERFEFNRPFSCVEIEFEESTVVLPTLGWDEKTIMWLDYDGKLNQSALTDIQFFCANAQAGSALAISVNCAPDPMKENRLNKLRTRVGEENVPLEVQEKDLAGWGLAAVCYRVISAQIGETIRQRNGGMDAREQLRYRQLFHFQYEDGTKMITVGGLLLEERQDEVMGRCDFESLHFVRDGAEWFRIEVPSLTFRELRYLDRALPPASVGAVVGPPGVGDRDVERYAGLYRYFPSFVDAEF